MDEVLGWQNPWPLTGPGTAAPDAVAACSRRPDQVDVLWVGPDRAIGMRSWSEAGGWADPWPLTWAVSEISDSDQPVSTRL